MKKASICSLLFFVATPALAIDCVDLKPSPPVNTNATFVGKLDASVDGLFAKLASVGTAAEGNYSKVSSIVLKEFPSADKLYMWERVLFLQCQLLVDASDVSSAEKLRMVSELYAKFGSPPPSTSGDTLTINGSNSIILKGNSNSVNTNR